MWLINWFFWNDTSVELPDTLSFYVLSKWITRSFWRLCLLANCNICNKKKVLEMRKKKTNKAHLEREKEYSHISILLKTHNDSINNKNVSTKQLLKTGTKWKGSKLCFVFVTNWSTSLGWVSLPHSAVILFSMIFLFLVLVVGTFNASRLCTYQSNCCGRTPAWRNCWSPRRVQA